MQASDLRIGSLFVDLSHNSPRKQGSTGRLRKRSVLILKYSDPSLSGHHLENGAFCVFDLGHSQLLSVCTHTTVSPAGLPIPSTNVPSSILSVRVCPCASVATTVSTP